MDIDREFIRAVIRGGKPAVLAAIDRDIDKEFAVGKDGKEKGSYLAGDGKKAWAFLRTHFGNYDEVPSVEAIESSTGIDLSGSMSESYQFFLDEIFKRRLWQLQRHGTKDVSEKLEAKDPNGAAEIWIEINRKIQEEALTVRKVESLLSLGRGVIADYKDAKAGKRGIPTPWASMDNQTLGWWPEDLILFVGRLGVGKCLETNSILQDPITGVQRTIGEVFDDPGASMVMTWSKEGGVHSAPITAKIDTGRKECLKFTLGTGRTIEVTPEHPFLTPDGWKRADEIAKTDSVALPMSMPFPLAPAAMEDAEVDILAVMLADGCVVNENCEFTKGDPEVVRIVSEAALTMGVEVVARPAEYQYGFRSAFGDGVNRVRDLMREHGVWGKKSTEKTIPDAVFKLGREQLARFLSLFWMCDGYVSTGGPEIVLASEKMLMQVQSLLLRFGIQSRISKKPSRCNGKTFPAWRLRVYSFCQDSFLKSFPLWGHRLDNLKHMASLKKNSNVGFPKLSKSLRSEIEELSRARAGRWSGGLLKEVGNRLGWKSRFMTRSLFGKHDSLLIDRFKVFCEVYGCTEKYSWLWGSGIFWDLVSSIENVGEKKIYDLTVDPTSCFIANDIVVHNTWTLVICAHKAWKAGHKVLVVSTEMNKMQMARRFFALHLRLPYDEIRRGKLGEFVENKFFQGVEEILSDQGIDIVAGDFDYSIDNIATVIADIKPQLMCLDGPYLIKNVGKDRHEKVSNTFDDFKKIGKRTGVATITNLQFNRSAKTGQSQTIAADNIGITDVAGWNADAAYGLNQSDEMRANWQMGIKGLKIREGMPDEFLINWNHAAMDFSEIGGSPQPSPAGAAPKNMGGGDSSFAIEEEGFDDVPF
jgi:intein/homing endonuclease